MIKRKETSTKTKVIVYIKMFKPNVWMKQQKNKVEAMEMRWAVEGIKRRNRIRNYVLREELRVETLMNRMPTSKMVWLNECRKATKKNMASQEELKKSTRKTKEKMRRGFGEGLEKFSLIRLNNWIMRNNAITQYVEEEPNPFLLLFSNDGEAEEFSLCLAWCNVHRSVYRILSENNVYTLYSFCIYLAL